MTRNQYRNMMTRPSESEVRRAAEQRRQEEQINRMKDLAGVAYMGSNE